MSSISFKLKLWIEDRLPDKKQRRMVFILVPVVAVCLAWIVLFAVRSAAGNGGTTRVRPTKEVRHAAELTKKLQDEAAFGAVRVHQDIDMPERFLVIGTVKNDAELELLSTRLTELDPVGPFEVEVRVSEGK